MSDAAATEARGAARVAVIGAGTMGRGIAQLALQAGHVVTLVEPNASTAASASTALHDLFERLAAKGRLDETPSALLDRLTLAGDVTAAAGADWVIEAVPEDLRLKRELFARLAEVAPRARLATNTSTLSVTAIAAGCARAEDVIGMHFFNPPRLMRLVEVVPGVETRASLVTEAVVFARQLGREPVVAQDSPGFIVNRLARPYYLEALRLHAEGVPLATCDAAMRAAGFAMGPFELLDLIGLDVNLASSESVYQAFYQEPRYRPHPLQRRMVEAGLLGRKVGRGFYRYDERGRRLDSDEREPRPRDAAALIGPGTTVDGRSDADARPRPAVEVLGDGPVAEALRAHLPPIPVGAQADIILDAGMQPASQPGRTAANGGQLLVLAWGRSASTATEALLGTGKAPEGAATHHGRSVLGFSVVPGARSDSARLTLELLAPPSQEAAEAAGRAATVLEAAGVTVLHVPDQPGGVAFRLVALLVNEAVTALAEGLAVKEDLDTAMRLGVNYPLGPLEWGERLGLANVLAALDSLHRETGAARFAPHPLLRRLVAMGRTTFTTPSDQQPPPTDPLSDTMEQ